jgi:predicted nucleotidyltransferase
MTLDQLRQRRAEIERLVNQYGAHDIRIFGSVARGEAGRESDIDVLVKFDHGRSLLDLVAIQQDLADMLGCNGDVVSEGALRSGDRILREAVSR